MKKALLTVALAVATLVGANAQWFVGGGIGFNTNTAKDGDGNQLYKSNEFTFTPEVGYSLTEKLDVGLDLSIGTEKTKEGADPEAKGSSWAVAPFAQYSFIEFGKFKVIGKASLSVGGTSGYDIDATTGDIELAGDDKLKMMAFGLNITPSLHYVLSDKFTVFGNLNFLTLGFNSATVKYDGDKVGSLTGFNFGVDANNLANTGNIQLGFVYKF